MWHFLIFVTIITNINNDTTRVDLPPPLRINYCINYWKEVQYHSVLSKSIFKWTFRLFMRESANLWIMSTSLNWALFAGPDGAQIKEVLLYEQNDLNNVRTQNIVIIKSIRKNKRYWLFPVKFEKMYFLCLSQKWYMRTSFAKFIRVNKNFIMLPTIWKKMLISFGK
jgi:hypothetical protein